MTTIDLLTSNIKLNSNRINLDYYYSDDQYRACSTILIFNNGKVETGLYISDLTNNKIVRNGFK